MIIPKAKLHPQLESFISSPLFMTREALSSFLSQMFFENSPMSQAENPLTYMDETKQIAAELLCGDISLTTSYNETDIPDDSIAFHRVVGTIFAEYSRWGYWFSTKKFIDDIRAAEENPKIIAHFAFINSGGGEAWYLEKAFKAVGETKKPFIVFIEKRCCSAGYYLGVNADRIFTTSVYDTIGSIGTMIAFLDIIPYFEKMGARWIEEYADQSTLKNKKFNDLLDGKPKKFKEKELNPLAQSFINDVRTGRKQLADLKEKHDVFSGETYYAEESRSIGLIDEISDLDIALQYTLAEGKKYQNKINRQSKMTKYVN